MRNFKNNLNNKNPKNNKNSKYKVISLFSLSTLALTLTLNDFSKVNAMMGRTPTRFYGSNGARPIPQSPVSSRPGSPAHGKVSGIIAGGRGTAGNFKPITSSGSGVGSSTPTPSQVKPVWKLPGSGSSSSFKPSADVGTGSGSSSSFKPSTGVGTGSGSSSGLKPNTNVGTQTSTHTSSVGTQTSTSGLKPITSTTGVGTKPTTLSGASGSLGQKVSTGTQTDATHQTGTTSTPSRLSNLSEKVTKPLDKLSKKQKLGAVGALGLLGLAGIIGGVVAGTQANSGGTPSDSVNPPKLVPVPATPGYTTGHVSSAAGNRYIDE